MALMGLHTGTTTTAVEEPAASSPTVSRRATGTLRGRVLERGTRRPLADIGIHAAGTSTFTDPRGRFVLSDLPAGAHRVRLTVFEHQPPEPKAVEITGGAETIVGFFPVKLRVSPYAVEVRGRRAERAPTRWTFDMAEVTVVPGTQGDTLKAVQTLPGTARTGFGLGGLVVRGSPARDTRVFLDGLEIPKLYHFEGLSSVINPDTLESISFVPGNYSVRHGRGLGGIVALDTRRSARPAPHGYLDIDLLDVTFLVEADVGGGSLVLSGRRSWVDTFFQIFFSGLGDDLETAPRTYDYQARYAHSLFGGELTVALVGADDAFGLRIGDAESGERPLFINQTSFHQAQLVWSRRLSNGWRTNVAAAAGLDVDRIDVGRSFVSDLDRRRAQLRLSVDKRLDWVDVGAGVDLQFSDYAYRSAGPPPNGPDAVVVQPSPVPDLGMGTGFDVSGATQDNIEDRVSDSFLSPAAWLELVVKPFDALRVVPGVRLERHGVGGQTTLDPRVTALVFPFKSTTLKAGAGLFHAPPDLRLLTPRFGSPDLVPERALHYSVGVEQRLPWSLEVSGEVFLKDQSRLAVQTVPSGESAATDVTDRRVLQSTGEGRSYGLELFARRRAKIGLSGWVAYTLSRSERATRQDAPTRIFAFDQTHVVSAVASYRTRSDWTLGARLQLATGSPFTPVTGRVFVSDTAVYAPVFADEPTERVEGFVQLDVRVDKEWVFREVIASLYVDVQNVTNASNAEGFQYNFDYTQRTRLPSLPVLPTIGAKVQF